MTLIKIHNEIVLNMNSSGFIYKFYEISAKKIELDSTLLPKWSFYSSTHFTWLIQMNYPSRRSGLVHLVVAHFPS